MNRTDVQGTLREMWDTRPARPHDGRQVAGVAAAIARRYDIDPVLVRVGFVVAAFSGIGAMLYIAGWIALPSERGACAGRSGGTRSGLLTVAVAVAAVISVGAMFDGDNDVLLPALAVAGLLFLLHRSRGDHRHVDTRATGQVPDPAAASTVAGPTVAGPSLSKDAPVPPAWDPLGVAPFAWDLPEPSPAAPAAPQRRRLPVTPVTLGLALLAGGITAVVLLLADALTLANLPLLFGVLLAVVGSGLVLGAFVRSGRGLIPIALLLGAMTWGVVAAPLDHWQHDGFGDVAVAPRSVGQLQPSYERGGGTIDLDLRGLDLAAVPGDGGPVRTRVELGVGDVQVRVPADADLTLNADVGIGDATFGDENQSGPSSEISRVNDLGTDGVVSGRPLVIDIEVGAGDVQVRRG